MESAVLKYSGAETLSGPAEAVAPRNSLHAAAHLLDGEAQKEEGRIGETNSYHKASY
jgi:hypothetical protein